MDDVITKLLNHRLCELKGEEGMKRLNRRARREENFMIATCNYVKKNIETMGLDGINNSSYLRCIILCFLWAICCLLSHVSSHNGLFLNKEEINCLLMAQCAL